ncbi:MAG: hypothetical protein F6K24_00175 [Okeania sp. SIO2D1]|nr:hypothetical protein [Okeania sp. SIO2D1]
MSDLIIVDGDKAEFKPNFGAAVVAVRLGEIKGSGKSSLISKNVCIDGDEKSVAVPGCSYIAGAYIIPGVGTLKIAALADDQIAQKTYSASTPMILKGSNFIAKFEVQTPAFMPLPLIPDVVPQYLGTGSFITTNAKWRGT